MALFRDLQRTEAAGCAAAGLIGAFACSFAAPPIVALLAGYLLFTALAIALVDYRSFIIPDTLSLPAIPLGVVASLVEAKGSPYGPALIGSLLGAALAGGSFYLVRSAYRRLRGFEGLGMGDVKLAAAAGAWVGIEALPLVLLMATAAAVSAVAVRYVTGPKDSVSRTTPMPFGAFLAPSIWLIWVYREVLAPA